MDFIFDIDETLVKGDIVLSASYELNRDGLLDRIYTNRDVGSWDFREFPEILRQRIYEMFLDPLYAVHDKKFIEGVLPFLYALKGVWGCSVALLTARPMALREDTIRFFAENAPDLFEENNIMFLDENIKKSDVLGDLKPKYFFDDSPKNCEECDALNVGIETYMVCNNYTPWTKTDVSNRIKRIKNVCFFDITKIM